MFFLFREQRASVSATLRHDKDDAKKSVALDGIFIDNLHMKILIIGPLGAGKSSLAYEINKRCGIPRLNLDEICRDTAQNGAYRSIDAQQKILNDFLARNASWVAEGCQKFLYSQLTPDLVVDMRIGRMVAIFRFTRRFYHAKKLIGKHVSPDLPVQAYHYRKITPAKIMEYDKINRQINAEIADFLQCATVPVMRCRQRTDYSQIFEYITRAK